MFIDNVSIAKFLSVSNLSAIRLSLYIHFLGALAPMTEFCQVQNSLYVQVLRSPILAALLHGTPAAGVSQTLRRGTRNGITELSQIAPPIFDWAPSQSKMQDCRRRPTSIKISIYQKQFHISLENCNDCTLHRSSALVPQKLCNYLLTSK